MSASDSGEELWKRFCAAEDTFYEARMALFKSGTDLSPFIDAALRERSRIHTGLRLLEIMPEEASRRHVAELVSLASWYDPNLGLVRLLLSRIDRPWLLERIDSFVLPILRDGDGSDYRRIAELYQELGGGPLLAEHLRRCASHPDPDVREIADDFAAA